VRVVRVLGPARGVFALARCLCRPAGGVVAGGDAGGVYGRVRRGRRLGKTRPVAADAGGRRVALKRRVRVREDEIFERREAKRVASLPLHDVGRRKRVGWGRVIVMGAHDRPLKL
jgi:hypothetical protein